MVIAAARKSSARKKVSRHGGFKPIDGRSKAGRALSSLDKAAEANKKRLRAVKSKAKSRAKSANNQVVKALKPVDGSRKPVGITLKTGTKSRSGTGRRGRKAGFKHSAATKKKISAAMKKVWAGGKRRKLKIKKASRKRSR